MKALQLEYRRLWRAYVRAATRAERMRIAKRAASILARIQGVRR